MIFQVLAVFTDHPGSQGGVLGLYGDVQFWVLNPVSISRPEIQQITRFLAALSPVMQIELIISMRFGHLVLMGQQQIQFRWQADCL